MTLAAERAPEREESLLRLYLAGMPTTLTAAPAASAGLALGAARAFLAVRDNRCEAVGDRVWRLADLHHGEVGRIAGERGGTLWKGPALGAGHAIALVTLGGDGALVVSSGQVTEVNAPAVAVVDTIGAGDAFMGSFLAQWRARGLGRHDLARLDQVQEAAQFACRVAAITCSRSGADPPRAAEL